jgi:hypothetical protein
MKPYEFRVTVLCEDNSQVRFGATTFGLADKLARTLCAHWPHAIKTFMAVESSSSVRVLKTYERCDNLGGTGPIRILSRQAG